ncbi:MAG TPA: super-infection exclusion protein B, partial [Verrucomicrobiota bacterium]|nr:super-infection exclusion protein B [Verrucomicrobiota bacterium]
GVVFIGSVCLFSLDLVYHTAEWLKGGWRNWNHRKLIRRRLRNLTDAEKLILQPYLTSMTRTCYFELGNGVVIGLERCGILGCVSGDQNNKGFPYNISDTAWDYIRSNRCSLEEQTKPR